MRSKNSKRQVMHDLSAQEIMLRFKHKIGVSNLSEIPCFTTFSMTGDVTGVIFMGL